MSEARVVVCVGPGGVGKTTAAAALALQAARTGLKACVVTIDPARRLADALGVGTLGNEPHLVSPPTEGWPGQLWAVMLDAQGTFDQLVSRYATSPGQAEAIFRNRLYRNIAGALSGTQEYMAVEKLYELQEDPRFDIVVVDTPPAQHALDFLEAPAHLVRMLDNRVFRLLMTPTRAGVRVLEMGVHLMVRTIAKVAGGQVVSDTLEFFSQFEGMEAGFRARADRANELLRSGQASFVLVCSPRVDAVDEALHLVSRLERAGASVKSVVINRNYPRFTPVPDGARFASSALGPLVANLEELGRVAASEDAQVARVKGALPGVKFARVPLLAREVCDISSLAEVASYLGEHAY
jgi:anion-transporting  ArsA/GET3 family ATPase